MPNHSQLIWFNRSLEHFIFWYFNKYAPFHVYLAQTPITEDGIAGVEYLKGGIDQLIKLIDEVVVKYNGWGIIEQTRGGIGPGFLHSKNCLFY